MVAQELRIGNWLLSLGKDGIWYPSLVSKITPNEIVVGVGFIRELKPIPLTEEIVNNCFDNELKLTGSIIINGIELQFKGNCLTNFYINNTMCHQKTNEIEIKYIHTLQNFYFALCGQELKIKL